MNDARRKTLDELTALTERLDLYNEPTRVGDESSVALSHALQELRWVEAERDRLREALQAVMSVDVMAPEDPYYLAYRIASEALAEGE